MAEIVYWDEGIETTHRDRIVEIQWQRLKDRLRYLEERSPLYRRNFRDAGLKIDGIQDLDDFRRLVPMTTKKDMREERERSKEPFGGLLCVPPWEIVHLIRTAGTTGVPSIYGMTLKDVRTLGELSARMWYQIGARKGHIVACATMGSWNYFSKALLEGLRTAGITVYHFSMPVPGEEVFPIEILSKWMDIQGLYISARPLWQVTEKYGGRLKAFLPKLQYLFAAGQRVTSSFRKGIESLWGGHFFEAYAITDVGLPASNCTEQFDTFHFPEDAFLVEVIDPETGEDLTGKGKVGEYVVTSLAMEGTPLLRFRTEDMGFSVTETCPCGRTGMRLGLSERLAHAVQIGDRFVFSTEVEEVLYGFPEFLLRPYHLVRKKEQPQEKLSLRVEQPQDPAVAGRLKKALITRLREAIGVDSEVEFISKEDERFVASYKFLRVVTE